KYNHKKFFIQKINLLFIGFIDEHFKLMKHTEFNDDCKIVATQMTVGFNISKFLFLIILNHDLIYFKI
ncbi:TPA: hypothetical protein ACF9NS_002723, partial [Staphylococcus aureus]